MPRYAVRAGAFVLLLVLAACSAGPSERPAVAYRGSQQQVEPAPRSPEPAPVPPLGPSGEQALDWRDCTQRTSKELNLGEPPKDVRFSCTRLLTSLSPPGATSAGTARIALLGVGTGKVPLVVVNDIGGEPGTTFAAKLALKMPEKVLRRFTIIGMDRRGSGRSQGATCVPPTAKRTLIGYDPSADDRAELAGLFDAVRSASQECLLDLEDRAQAYDTWRTAADLEELRIELGVPKLHGIGRGEGSRVLTTYAQRYPGNVGRMVLDGAPDPTLKAQARIKRQAEAAERTFDEFADSCERAGDCPLGSRPRAAVRDLIERAREKPLADEGGEVTAGEITRAVLAGLGDPASWPKLRRALAEARAGDATRIRELLDAPSGRYRRSDFDARLITRCNDTMLRLPPERAAGLARQWVGSMPLFGGVYAQRLIRCSLWPRPQRALPAPERGNLPPIPVIATENDPYVPKTASKNMAGLLAAGITVNWQGTGHGAIGRSECVMNTVARYLVDGKPPARETACPA